MPIPEALRRAYLATAYRAKTPLGILVIRIGEPLAALDALLEAQALDTWAFVTAWNPRSRAASLEENQQAQQRLRERIAAGGWPSYVGAGVPADGEWGPEPSVLVLGIAAGAALALGRAFEQNAIVVGERGGPARLVDCFPPEDGRPAKG